jgi:hypothetical protein
MQTKRAYSLQDVILFLEALEMLGMVYKIEKHDRYLEPETGKELINVWIIEYEHGESLTESSLIQFED